MDVGDARLRTVGALDGLADMTQDLTGTVQLPGHLKRRRALGTGVIAHPHARGLPVMERRELMQRLAQRRNSRGERPQHRVEVARIVDGPGRMRQPTQRFPRFVGVSCRTLERRHRCLLACGWGRGVGVFTVPPRVARLAVASTMQVALTYVLVERERRFRVPGDPTWVVDYATLTTVHQLVRLGLSRGGVPMARDDGQRKASLLWVLAGGLLGLGALSLPSIGLFVLLAAVLAFALAVRVTGGRDWFLTLAGIGLPFLWVAWLHRRGPGVHCWEDGDVSGCDENLNPWPFLAIGLLLLAAVAGWWFVRDKERSTV